MLPKSIFRSSALAVLAVAMTATAIPSAAFAQAEQREERGRGWQRGGGDFRNQQAGQGQRAEWRREAQGEARPQRQPLPQAQPQAIPQFRPQLPPQAQAQPQRSPWGGSNPQAQQRPDRPSQPAWQGRAEGSQRDWGRQQGREDRGREDRGRDWQSGTVNRPAPDRAGTPAVPQRGWDGTRWNGTNPDAGRNWNRDGRDRDGRDWNRDGRDRNGRDWNRDGRDGRDWNRNGRDWNRDRNGTYSDRDRNRDYRHNDSWRRDNWRNHGAHDYRRWNNDWRRDNRYNWSHYRSVNRGIYRLPRYYAPYRGYNYNRLSVGIFLNSGFYGRNYWINDPWSYRLPQVYGGYRWVRYYDDVLLVDTYSGEVVDVIYDFFW